MSQHYGLAHVTLREIFYDDPLHFLGVFISLGGSELMGQLILHVAEQIDGPNAEAQFQAEDFGFLPTRIGVYPCLVIEMPVPTELPQAYLVGAFLGVPVDELDPTRPPDSTLARYFTLEFSYDSQGEPMTMLCEWTQDGAHKNYGEGPVPDAADFVQAIATRLGEQASPPELNGQ